MNGSTEQGASLRDRILLVLETNHVGRRRAVKAMDLALKLGESDDRGVRAAISQMRKEGHLILSAVSEPYGYFMAETAQEWREFRKDNLRARAMNILDTDRAMKQAAERRWGEVGPLIMLIEQPEVVA